VKAFYNKSHHAREKNFKHHNTLPWLKKLVYREGFKPNSGRLRFHLLDSAIGEGIQILDVLALCWFWRKILEHRNFKGKLTSSKTLFLWRDRSLTNVLKCCLKDWDAKAIDSSEETKHIAQIHTKERSLQNAQRTRIKEGYYRISRESYLRITRKTSFLVYTYVLKDYPKKYL
jgi:hypothetical protein